MVVEHRFDDVLAIIKRAIERDVVHIVIKHCGHLPALHWGGAALWMKNEDVGGVAPAKRLDSRRTGVTRSRAHNRGLEAALGKDVIDHAAQELHGDVLEGERRSVKQLKDEVVGLQLDQRGYRGVPKGSIGFTQNGFECIGRDLAIGEPADDGIGHIGIRLAGEGGDRSLADLGPALRHVQTAIGGQPGEDGVGKAKHGCLAARRNKLHWGNMPSHRIGAT